ncbi:EamA-like transporter family protein [Aspergillus niger]|uniref:EamA-like transporter family protein n=1 Tax=Aspergillus niger TaxID=5061 RepID=A0A505HXF1_ASPNG|nr:EamA-like transporter family protein [Aspergillus niger]
MAPRSSNTSKKPNKKENIKSLIQTIKTHLYNRDFDSAFTDANEDLLRAYALRWSSSRALGYAGIFRALLREVVKPVSDHAATTSTNNVVCIGGGAGAEIVALAAAWRDFMVGAELRSSSARDEDQIADAVEAVSLDDGKEEEDIADWSKVVERLSTAIQSPTVTGSKSHPAPLLPSNKDEEKKTPSFSVGFEKLDVLSTGEKELQGLFSRQGAESCSTVLVTLMFTLNELFSTSMAKATGFLLRMTDMLRPGTVLLVVDSPGSYSTLKLGKGGDGEVRERQYPMKFLLDHTLLSVAEGKWERLMSEDSRWWRRDAARLRYDVGEGAGLEDMRFQVHVYRRVGV